MSQAFRDLVELFERSVEAHRERPLLGSKVDGAWHWTTYGELAETVDALRAGLAGLGVGPGDRVAMIADNRIEWAVACYATYGLGASFVPMYEAQHAEEWRFILDDCSAKVVFVANAAIAAGVEEGRGGLPALSHIVRLDGAPGDPGSYAGLVDAGHACAVPSRRPGSAALAGLIYTSGTTGLPKGVMLSHGNITSNINAVLEIFRFSPEDRSLAFLPWAHSFGQVCELHGLLAMGSQIAINDDVASLLANLAEVKPTILYAVPRIFNRLYAGVKEQIAERPAAIQTLVRSGLAAARRKSRGERLGLVEQGVLLLADTLAFGTIRDRLGGRLKYAISGSAALDTEVASFIDALGIMVYEGYGLTETSPIVSANFPGHRKIGSVGRPIAGVTVVIDESVGDEPGRGEILVRGPNVMMGYHNRPEENAQVLLPDGTFRTGDLGYLDADGYLYVTGRIKEQYKLENGKYVVPSPIEEKVKLSRYVANVIVHGANKPHNVALIVPQRAALEDWARSEGIPLDRLSSHPKARELLRIEIDSCCRDLKGYERIKAFALVDEDFTTDNGMLTPTLKLKRRVVLARYGSMIDELY
jgi:long-chain acyl-CoA synthetase